MINPPLLEEPRPWAFSRAELTAGLRARTGDSSLVVTHIQELTIPFSRPSMGRIRGLGVICEASGTQKTFRLVVKEPQGATRTGTAGAGLREVSFYRNLVEQLPVSVPHLLAAHPDGDWLVFDMLPPHRQPDNWGVSEYLLATEKLVALHDRFWGLGEDLAAYTWLARPLDSEYEIYLQAARAGVRRLVDKVTSNLLTRDPKLIRMLKRLVENADKIAAALRTTPRTLLHGDYWPGNISIGMDNGIAVYDWQQASIGPGVLDLYYFIQASQWYFSPIPISPKEIVSHYRTKLAEASGHSWDDETWAILWDYALLWIFLCSWVDLLASIPASILQTRYPQMRALWLEPVNAAINRRIPGG
jgi:hypothetical protein